MTITRRDFHRFLLAALGSATLPALAGGLQQGRDYAPIEPPQPGDSPGKVEVLEFFSYGCPHCMEFHPLLMAWAAKLPAEVAFVRVPVSFGRAAWSHLARLYYALEITADLARLDEAVFRAIHRENISLFTGEAIREWALKQGVDEKRFTDAYDSFGLDARLKRNDQLVQRYKVRSVPLLTVAGRYAVTGEGATRHEDLLAIADGLILMARSASEGSKS